MNTKHKILTLVALTVFSAITPSFAEDNGYWWREQKAPIKAAYVSGMIKGLRFGAEQMQTMAETMNPKDTFMLETASVVAKQYRHEFTAKQLVDGMNRFYSDEKNRNIKTYCALHIVDMQLSGASKLELESVTRNIREIDETYAR
jgi:hypothetical protein